MAPVDANIPLASQFPHLLSPLEAQSQVGQVRAQQQQQAMGQQQVQMNTLALSEGQLRQQQLERQVAGARAVATTVGKHLQPDGTVDHAAVAADLSQQGFPEQGDAWLAHATATAEATSKLRDMEQQHTQRVIDAIAPLAKNVKSAADFDAILGQMAIPGVGALKPEEAAAIRSRALQLGPDGWKTVANQIVAQSTEAKTIRTVAPGGSVLQGSTPIYTAPNPVQAETVRHNQEMERLSALSGNRQAATEAETARHNRAMEIAQNPFAMAMGGAGGVQGGAPQTSPAPGSTPPPTGAGVSAPVNRAGLTGEDFLKTLPPQVASEVKAYSEGRRPFPMGMSYAKLQPMIALVGQYDPTFDAANYNARNKARSDFSPGGTVGKNQINPINTVIGHLGDLSDKVDALDNGSVQAVNSVKNWLKTATGSPDVTNFNTVRKAVTDELTRTWRQAGGAEADIRTWAESLNASQSPDQLKGAMATIGHLLESKLSAIEQQRDQVLGKYGSDIQIVFPKSRAVLDKIEGNTTAPTAAGAGRVRVKGPNGESGTVPKGSTLPAGWSLVGG